MQIYSYWARTTLNCTANDGSPYHLIAYTGSDESLAAAQAASSTLVQSRQARLLLGNSLHEYPTGTAPLREYVQQRIYSPQGGLIAALTRNHYGSLVLNTLQLMFLDVDDADLRRFAPKLPRNTAPFSLGKFFSNLFAPAPPPPPPADPREQLQTRLAVWLQLHPDWNFRVYRTRLGFRLLVTHRLLSPTSPEAQEVFAAMRVDTTYARLCQTQNCYRARLSPKPGRIGWTRPPHPFPYDTPEQAQQQQAWEQEYMARSQEYSVCEWVGEFGSGQVVAEARQLAELHDAACLGGRRLA